MRIGAVRVDAVADGTFVARPSHVGADVPAGVHPEVLDRDAAWPPPGCSVVRTGDRVVSVDAGLGPERSGCRTGCCSWAVGCHGPAGARAHPRTT